MDGKLSVTLLAPGRPGPFASAFEGLGESLALPQSLGVGALFEGCPAGAASCRVSGGVMSVGSLEVLPTLRRRGVGTAMFLKLRELSAEKGLSLIAPFSASGPLDADYRFCASLPDCSIRREAGYTALLDSEALGHITRLPVLPGFRATPFFTLPSAVRNAFFERLRAKGFAIGDELCARRESFSPTLCLCAPVDGRVASAAFVVEAGSELSFLFFYIEKGGERRGMSLLSTLASAMSSRLAKNGGGQVRLPLAETASVRLFERICPEFAVSERLYTLYSLG